jgi:hypothetical protein
MTDPVPPARRSPLEHERDAVSHGEVEFWLLRDSIRVALGAAECEGAIRAARRVAAERDALRARAEAAEAERDRVCAEWAEVSQRNYQRAKAAEAELARLRAGMEGA